MYEFTAFMLALLYLYAYTKYYYIKKTLYDNYKPIKHLLDKIFERTSRL